VASPAESLREGVLRCVLSHPHPALQRQARLKAANTKQGSFSWMVKVVFSTVMRVDLLLSGSS
jgi:hypothetical protein